MERSKFERLVRQALEGIPEELRGYLDNVDMVVEDWPDQNELAGHVLEEGDLLLGLYEGLPLTERSDYSMVLPDKITLYQGSIEEVSESDDEVVEQIKDTVVHEVAHHFGIDDERLEDLGLG